MMTGTCGGYHKVDGGVGGAMEEEIRCCDDERVDDEMLPGFRFHPTDEELVGFYLKRKIQQKPLPIELIRQLDIYKYDPWDLPKLATTGEKEWYFYCPRDRKYRNSARPNRVTSAGFWKATGTDRPIYSSEGAKCIGLKKSLVFYKGRAAKGVKTDWMMHEFRLPSTTDSKKPVLPDKKIPPNDSWAICRIFKKTSSMAQRAALTHSWAAHQLPEPANSSDMYFGSDVVSQLSNEASTTSCAPHLNAIPSAEMPASFCFSPSSCNTTDLAASILMSIPPSLVFGDHQLGKVPTTTMAFSQQQHESTCNNIPSFPAVVINGEEMCMKKSIISSDPQSNNEGHWQANFPLNVAVPSLPEVWKGNTQWESMPCSSENMSGSYMAKCYT